LLGCALVFASEAKIEIEAKILFRLDAQKGMISLVSHRSEKAKIRSENELAVSKKIEAKRKRTENCLTKKKSEAKTNGK
jgi:hypothetical protein